MKQAYLKYLAALLLFGSNGVVASYITLNSREIVFWRTLIGSLFLIVVLSLSRRKLCGLRNKKHFFYLIISGTAMGASWMLLYEAYQRIGVSVATLIYYCGPVIVMALSPFLFGERITSAKLSGFAVVVAGMFLISGNELMRGGGAAGMLCGILSAVMYAVMVIFNKKAVDIVGIENTAVQLFAGFLIAAIFTITKQQGYISPIGKNIFLILWLGIVNTGIGCLFYFSSIGRLAAGTVAVCGYLEPLSALVFSAVFLGERLMPWQAVGGMLILCGAAAGEYFHSRSSKRATEARN